MNTDLKYRSAKKELIDETTIHKDLLFKNLKELEILNRTTGGHALTMKGMKQLITDHGKVYHIVDLGCGGGDSLRAIAGWARKNSFNVQLTGVDRNAYAIDYLRDHSNVYPEITGIASDYREFLDREIPIDIVHCSFFCHHLSKDELIHLFTWFGEKATTGFVIIDLQRNRMAYYSAWLFTRLLKATVLAKNDGPVSVLRAFKASELKNMLEVADIRDYTIRKKPLYRFYIVGKTGNETNSG
jgi:SAM-dependent methyltransferase